LCLLVELKPNWVVLGLAEVKPYVCRVEQKPNFYFRL
jgi:hypothetical protein